MSLFNLTETATELKRLTKIGVHRPLFCVYEVELLAANSDGRFSGSYRTEQVWFLEDGTEEPYEIDEDKYQALEELSEGEDSLTVNGADYVKLSVLVVPRFATACFTRKAADEYIERNRHNLNRPFVEVNNLRLNAEMLGIRKFLINTF